MSSTIKTKLSVHFVTIYVLLCSIVLSRPLLNTHNIQTAKQALQTAFAYFSDEDLETFDLTASDTFGSPMDMYNPQSYLPINTSLPIDNISFPNVTWQEIFQTYEIYAAEQCKALDLQSDLCYNDCIYYNNLLTWIPLIVANSTNTLAKYQLTRMMSFYSMSAGPLDYDNVGNPDMCIFSGGTYCYTPALAGGFPLNQHACCLPGTCVGDDALKVLKNNNWCYKIFAGQMKQQFNTDITDICEPMPRELDEFGPLIVIIIFFIFLLLVIIASIIRRYCMEYLHDNENVVDNNTFIAAFNIESLWSSFRAVRPADKCALNFLDGIRVWSMTWVVLGHSYLFFYMSAASNMATFTGQRTDYTYLVQKFYTIFIQYAFYSVDSFFFLSGLLATFSIWRSIKKYGNNVCKLWYLWIPMAYLMRILRIVPMMMYITAIQWQLSDQIAYGYHIISRETYTEYCNHDWYKILFFYANLTLSPDSSEALNCMGHLWYIQVDMQLFLVLPFLLLIFAYNKFYGLIASLLPTLVCIIIRFYYAFYYDFDANFINPRYPTKHDGKLDVMSYYQPQTRMSVYFIGVTLMFIILIIDENKTFVLNKLTYFGFILCSSFLMLCIVVWPYDDVKDQPEHRWSLLSNQMYYALSRPTWGIALAFLTFALKYMNSDTQKSMIKSFLSLEIYQPLGKLTYLMYLLHLLVFSWWASDLEYPSYYNEWNELLLVIGVWAIVAIISFVLWFIMEKPMANLTTVFSKYIMNCCNDKRRGYKKSVNNEEQLLFDNNINNHSDDNDQNEEVSAYVPMGSINGTNMINQE